MKNLGGLVGTVAWKCYIEESMQLELGVKGLSFDDSDVYSCLLIVNGRKALICILSEFKVVYSSPGTSWMLINTVKSLLVSAINDLITLCHLR